MLVLTSKKNMDFDERGFKDEIELMNLQKQMMLKQTQNNQTLGFNIDTIYNQVENNL